MSRPLVSVIIPAYNAEKWLGEALRSVQAQTLTEWELIIVNDGSTDGTSEVARTFRDERMHVIEKPNGGVSSARNRGIDEARGSYIAFLDADDAMLPENLERKVAALEQHEADWTYSDMWQCDAELRTVGAPERGAEKDLITIILTAAGIAVPGISSNILAHRRCFEGGIRFDPALSNEADQDIVLSLAREHRYVRVPDALAKYRVLPGSMSRSISLYEADHLRLFEKARRNGLMDDPAFRRRCMASAYWAIGGSWWVNANNKRKALPYIVRSLWLDPGMVLRKTKGRLSGQVVPEIGS